MSYILSALFSKNWFWLASSMNFMERKVLNESNIYLLSPSPLQVKIKVMLENLDRVSFHDKDLKAWVCRSVALIFPFLLHYNGGLSKAFWYYLYKAKSNKMYSKLELTHPNYYCFFKIFTLESRILNKTQNFSYPLHSCCETGMTLKAQYLNIPKELGRHHHHLISKQLQKLWELGLVNVGWSNWETHWLKSNT